MKHRKKKGENIRKGKEINGERNGSNKRSRLRRKKKKRRWGGKKGEGEMEPKGTVQSVSANKASCFFRAVRGIDKMN